MEAPQAAQKRLPGEIALEQEGHGVMAGPKRRETTRGGRIRQSRPAGSGLD